MLCFLPVNGRKFTEKPPSNINTASWSVGPAVSGAPGGDEQNETVEATTGSSAENCSSVGKLLSAANLVEFDMVQVFVVVHIVMDTILKVS